MNRLSGKAAVITGGSNGLGAAIVQRMADEGAAIAVLLFVGMVPMFLGLFIVLPLLGHASWHMYRRILSAA